MKNVVKFFRHLWFSLFSFTALGATVKFPILRQRHIREIDLYSECPMTVTRRLGNTTLLALLYDFGIILTRTHVCSYSRNSVSKLFVNITYSFESPLRMMRYA